MDLEKNNQKLIGSIIKFNRIKLKLSQKQLAKGICVPSYLSRIESGDLLPSEDVISMIFTRLGLTFNDSQEFIDTNKKKLDSFFTKLNLNEFDYTNSIFQEIEIQEEAYISSPLIIEYFLAKLARYACTPERDKFNSTWELLLSSLELLSPSQRYVYNFYLGIDFLIISEDKDIGKKYIEAALAYKETGHCHYWLSYAYRLENNPIKAYEAIKRALELYLSEGNILSIMDSYEKEAEVHFMLNNYIDAIQYLEMAVHIAEKLNNNYFIEHLNSILAWTYYRLKDYETSLNYLSLNTGLIDHRMVIPDSIIESLIYFELNDRVSLKKSMAKLNSLESLEHIDADLSKIISKLFNYYLENEDYMKSVVWEGLLIYIIDGMHKLVELRKIFTSMLKDYYVYNRKYKDALYL